MAKGSVIVTGAGGFTGRHACRRLAEKGYNVAAILRHPDNTQKISGVNYYTCDLTDPEQIRNVIAKVEPTYCLHLAGRNAVSESWEQPVMYMQTNVMATIYLLDALRECGTKRIVIAGSRLKFDLLPPLQPTHPYGLSKSVQEIVALAWGELFQLKIVIAEPSNLIGPGPSTGFCSLLAGYIVHKERRDDVAPFHLSSTKVKRDFLDVRDAVDAYEILLTSGNGGQIYQVCSGIERRLGDVVDFMSQLTSATLDIRVGDVSHASQSVGSPIFTEELKQLGWEPKRSWEESLTEIMDYHRKGESR